MGRFRIVTLNIRCDLIRSQSNHGRGVGKKDSEPPGVGEDFGGNFQLELKLQDSVRGSANKGLRYVTHLVFLCKVFHNKVSLVSPHPQIFYHIQAATYCPEGKFSTSNKSLSCKKTDIFFQE